MTFVSLQERVEGVETPLGVYPKQKKKNHFRVLYFHRTWLGRTIIAQYFINPVEKR